MGEKKEPVAESFISKWVGFSFVEKRKSSWSGLRVCWTLSRERSEGFFLLSAINVHTLRFTANNTLLFCTTMSRPTTKPLFPQALTSTFAHRLSHADNALYANLSTSRVAKRQASKINYAEDFNDDFEDENTGANGGGANGGGGGGVPGDGAGEFGDGEEFGDGDGDIWANDDDGAGGGKGDDDDEDYVDDEYYYDMLSSAAAANRVNASAGNKEAPKKLPDIVLDIGSEEVVSGLVSQVIPIKVKVTTNGAVVNDRFLWDLNDPTTTPELFVSILADELDLSRNAESMVLSQMKEQIQTYRDLFANPNNTIIDQFLSNEKEFHVVLDVSTNIGEDFFTDKVEWDLLDSSLTPERFADTVVSDLGLKPEFRTAIAVALYEEMYKLKKELIENPQQVSQYIDSLPFFNLAQPGKVQGLRYDVKKYGEEFTPSVERLSEWEIEKRETEKERNLRRRKRETLRVAGVGR